MYICVCVCVTKFFCTFSPRLAETCCNKTLQHIKVFCDSYYPYVHKYFNTSAVREFAWARNRKVQSLSTPWKHVWSAEVQLQPFLISTLGGSEWSASHSGCFTRRKWAPDTHWLVRSVGSTACLDFWRSEESPASAGTRTLDRQGLSLVTVPTELSLVCLSGLGKIIKWQFFGSRSLGRYI
jgi:hypothetical protein